MTRDQLLDKLDKARQSYRVARDTGNLDTMAKIEKIARDIKMRLKCICLQCKQEEKTNKDWPFCSKKCEETYENNRVRTMISPTPTIQMDQDFNDRMKRIPEILRLIREKQKSVLPISSNGFKHD